MANLIQFLNSLNLDMCLKNTNHIVFTDFCLDSRLCHKGDVMLVDKYNINHLESAIKKGCVAFISDIDIELNHFPVIHLKSLSQHKETILKSFYGLKSVPAQLIGITGTNGKTSTAHFLAQLLSKNNKKIGVLGTNGNGLYQNGKAILTASELTTLDTIRLYQTLSKLIEQNVEYLIMEISSHSLAQKRILGLCFDVVVFCNLTHEHLDYHNTIEDYFSTKALLFKHYTHPNSKYIINTDDVFGERLKTQLQDNNPSIPNQNIIDFGIDNQGTTIYANDINYLPQSLTFNLHSSNKSELIKLNLLGQGNLYNVLCTYAIIFSLNLTNQIKSTELETLETVNGRMQIVNKNESRPTVIVDFAHTPVALETTLKFLGKHGSPKTKIWCVFGCGGDRDTSKRELMGKISLQWSDHIVITDDNPRTENPKHIRTAIIKGIHKQTNVNEIADRKEAIKFAINNAQYDDLIVIAGKGHEKFQIIEKDKFPFDDVAIAKELLYKTE